jgi:hypothetical protein
MTSPQAYAPRSPTILDNLGYTQRVVDAILRNNPLTDAMVSEGLVRWIGNYTNAGNPDKINFMWIGEFFPADPNLGGIAQRGISMVRDDSRGGVSAFAMYDPNPGAGGGLRQVITLTSGDARVLARESRNGGWGWPEENVAMCPLGFLDQWPGTQSAAFDTLAEGRANALGRQLHYRVWFVATNGAAGEGRVRVEGVGGDVMSSVTTIGVNGSQVAEGVIDISASRGSTVPVRLEARRTNGAGEMRAVAISIRSYTTPMD